MALTPMVSTRCDKGQEQTVAQVRQFYEQFLLYVREGLQSLGLPLARATLAQPHDAVFAWTATTLFVVASPGSATHVTSTHTYRDFTAVAGISPQALKQTAAREFGWEDMVCLRFEWSLVRLPKEEREAALREEASKYAVPLADKARAAQQLGVDEALAYLENARRRYGTGTAEGFSDCKANCRNAILSLLAALAGTQEIRQAVKKLHKQGLLGEREMEVVQAVEDLVAKLHGMASKTGTHPPMANRADAQLALRLAEAVVSYLISNALQAKERREAE